MIGYYNISFCFFWQAGTASSWAAVGAGNLLAVPKASQGFNNTNDPSQPPPLYCWTLEVSLITMS